MPGPRLARNFAIGESGVGGLEEFDERSRRTTGRRSCAPSASSSGTSARGRARRGRTEGSSESRDGDADVGDARAPRQGSGVHGWSHSGTRGRGQSNDRRAGASPAGQEQQCRTRMAVTDADFEHEVEKHDGLDAGGFLGDVVRTVPDGRADRRPARGGVRGEGEGGEDGRGREHPDRPRDTTCGRSRRSCSSRAGRWWIWSWGRCRRPRLRRRSSST